MNDWITALEGRYLSDERVTFDTSEPARQAMERTVITPLVHLGVLDVSGPGADKLLQGQTSAQVDLANGSFAPLTCFCSAKGRMLANAQLLRIDAERYRLILHRGLLEPLRDHLKKFAPFYKSELAIRDDLVLLGLIGKEAQALAEVRFDAVPPAVWHQSGDETVQLLAHPGPQHRLLACLPLEQAEAVATRLSEQAAPVGNAVWCLQDIQAGLAWLTPAHQDALLPQMINWEALGGISFKKGCYTGQEVVARAHFRGQVKKRLARAQLEGSRLPELGASVVDADGKAAGEIVAAELDAYGQAEILAVLTTREDIGPLSVDGQAVKLLKLPYPIERLDPENLTQASA
ncbi:folate-binding protein [Billgrantia tianxiuensis]|uniref:Folate-binding protein n=1 Tax=Billgrantia tianxiuensis TaxID=2497861 RepID=A0A6I6SLQ3_9GAMM|nr:MULTISPECIES: folate-binding protein [Halomonas]MCE8031676.1 folate-binding protein YgfZ [Halomonas sp. MCCC 1A11057]QHC50191.1 folate-binding protein [Halomonas tianxiuensis]